MSDYTLPCLPGPAIAKKYGPQVEAYGHAVAAPLLARIAELEAEIAQVSGYCETLTQRCVDDTAENGRLRAEVEALRAGIEKAISEIDDAGPKALKYARQELEAAIAARKGEGSEG